MQLPGGCNIISGLGQGVVRKRGLNHGFGHGFGTARSLMPLLVAASVPLGLWFSVPRVLRFNAL